VTGAGAFPAHEGRPVSSVPRRVWGATLLSALARQWSALCTFLSMAVLARSLAPEDFGRFTFYLAVLSFLDVFVDCGTSTVAVQRGVESEGVFAAALAAGRRVRAGAALLGALVVALAAGLAREDEAGRVALAGLGPLARVPEMSAVVFQRDIAWGRPLLGRARGGTLRLVLLGLLSRVPGVGFGPLLAAHSLALAAANTVLHFVARPRLPPPAPPLPGLLASALPLALTGLVQQAYFYADNGFVRAFAGTAALGRYNAAVRLFLWLSFFAAFATSSALPWLARSHRAGELGAAVRSLLVPLVLGASGVAGLLHAARVPLLTTAFGAGFEVAATSLGWLLLALLAVALGAPLLTALLAMGRTRSALVVALAALGVNLAANLLLVPRLGIDGAGLATLVTEAGVALLAWTALRQAGVRLGRPPLALLLAAPLFGLGHLAGGALLVPLLALLGPR